MTGDARTQQRAQQLFAERLEQTWRSTDRFFIGLMLVQFAAGIVFAVTVSPRTWSGIFSQVHLHVWTAILLGGLIPAFPICLALWLPGRFVTRCVIASAQMLVSALLIHLTGGRIETHFHVFGSLAFLAFYRDWRILIPATLVVAVDHAVRGVYWPESVYGVMTASVWRSVEHAAWVAFEDVVLVMGCVRSVREVRQVCEAQAALERANSVIEARVEQRTRELSKRTSELADANTQIQAILDGAADAIVTIDPRGIIRSFNTAAERAFGYSAAETVGANVSKLMPEPHSAEHDGYLRRYRESGERRIIGQTREVAARRKDGSTFPIELRVSELSVSGRPLFCGIIRDITRRKENQELQAERERNTALIADVAVALNLGGPLRSVLQKCAAAVVHRLDAAFARVWTIDESASTLELQASAGMYTHIDGGHARVPVGQFKIGRIAQNRKPHLTNDVLNDPHVGDAQWARREGLTAFAGYPLIVDDALVGVVALFSRQPLSAATLAALGAAADNIASGVGRKRAEERLARTQSQLLSASRTAGMAEIATGVLHNVGNALNSVNVSASVVQDRVRGMKVDNLNRATTLMREHADDLERFLGADERGKRLPGYLLKLAASLAGEQAAILSELGSLAERIDHIKTIVKTQQSYARSGGLVETLSLSDTLEDALRMHLAGLERHGVSVAREFERGLPPLQTDKHKLLQILLNLLGNARQAMCDPSVKVRMLTLRAGLRGNTRAYVEVRDTGVGIPREDLTRIFSHGFTTKKDGHGFGLHSCANAAREIGGAIAVSSPGPGAGATFVLELPLQLSEDTYETHAT